MNFGSEHNLLYLWLVIPLLIIFWQTQKVLAQRLKRFADEKMLNRLYQLPARTFRYALLSLALVAMVLALAAPRLGYEWIEVDKRGRDIFVALDVSRSMLASDIVPNRLERAKRKLTDLLGMLSGDRISLIAFAGAAFVQCPLTTDYVAAKIFLDHLQPGLIPVQGTAIGEALRLALNSVKKSSNPEGAAIILITDGEDQGTDPLATAKKAKDMGVKIFAIGIGGPEGAPIPGANGNFVKDQQGNLVLTKLNEETLQQLALTTDGVYVRSVSGDFDLEQIYHLGIRERVKDIEFNETKKKLWHEHFHFFLLMATFLLLSEFFLGSRRKKLLTLILLLNLNTAGNDAFGQNGHKLFEQKKYDEAAQNFLEQEIDNPTDLETVYNRAVSQYFAQNYTHAVSGFARATTSKDPQLAFKAWFNLGNTQVALQRLEEAQKSYEQALKIDPQNKKAQENLEWVKQQLEHKKKNKQEQTQNQQDQEQEQKQEQTQNQQGQEQEQKQEQAQNQQDQEQQKQAHEQQQAQEMSKEEVAKLLRQLKDKVGVKPRKLKPAKRKKAQDW